MSSLAHPAGDKSVDPKAEAVSSTPSSSSSDGGDPLVQGDYGSQGGHVFENETNAVYWEKVYEQAQYEGRHRFAPRYTWTAKEEKKLLRKIDLRIMIWAWLMFFSLDLNRRNINRAIADTLLPDLDMNTNDFNYAQTIFLASFLAAELPSGLISKKLGPDRWIPFIICGWSITSAAQAACTTRGAFFACRAILGLLMGGFIPDVVLYLTYFYKSKELPIRLSWFWTVLSTANIVGSLLAAGILEMRGLAGLAGWQWLFILEGCITVIIGFFSWGLMPPGPCQTRNWFRGKDGWFSDHEEHIMVNRLLRDDPSKGDMHNRQAVTPSRLLKSLSDFDLWPLYLLGLLVFIPAQPVTSYLTLNLRQLGFSVFQANLLAIPSQFFFAVNLLLITWASERLNSRALISSISNIWMLPCFVALIALPASANAWARYAVLTVLLSYPYCHAVLVGWNARNSNAVRTRAVSAALYNMCVQAGNIIGSNIYRDDDKPLYRRGNKVLVGICAADILLFVAVRAYYVWRNKTREAKWSTLSKSDQEEYVATTRDEGAKRLDFRFEY